MLRCAAALAQHGDQDLLGEGERGLVAVGGLPGGLAAVGDVVSGFALAW